MLWVFALDQQDWSSVSLLALNLENFGICAPKSAEEEKISSLFMSQIDSDITFKVDGHIIPAHKQALMKKSEGIFGSGAIIEIEDCEYEIFKEYLRFIYQDTVDFKDTNQKIKLYVLADKYSQDDLKQKCVNSLSHNISQKNVYEILDFAHQENIHYIKIWCIKFFDSHRSIGNVTGLIEYLEHSAFKEGTKELRNFALNLVFDSLTEIENNEKGDYNQVYVDFLLKNIEIGTLAILAKGISKYFEFKTNRCQKNQSVFNNVNEDEKEEEEDEEDEEDEEENIVFMKPSSKTKVSLEEVNKIKEAVLTYIFKNMKTLMANGVFQDLKDFITASLFMSQIESDITLKVEDQLIPAHKQVLVERSLYFEKVFNSGMAESKQNVIEIQEDCEYEIFKEYLRFIYQGEVHLDDDSQILKLYVLADKYLQEDLCKECVRFLSQNVNEDNFSQLLDFANEKHLSDLKSCCVAFFQEDTNFKNVAKAIEYLERQGIPTEFKENNQELKSTSIHFVLNNFFDEKGDPQVYENFLLKNIGMDTISLLVHFLSDSSKLENKIPNDNDLKDFSGPANISKEIFNERTAKLKEAVFSFLHENAKTVMIEQIIGGFSSDFLTDFTLFSNQIQDTKAEMNVERQNEEKKENTKKRMEPVQDGSDEENPTLKKTK